MKEFLHIKKEKWNSIGFESRVTFGEEEEKIGSPDFTARTELNLETLNVREPNKSFEYSPTLTWSSDVLTVDEIHWLKSKVDAFDKETF